MRQALESKLKSWFVPPSSGVHLNLADGLRGVAIILVVCCHGFYYNPATSSNVVASIVQFIQTGWIGVRLFFVLSGFLIALPFFQKRQSDPAFWVVPGYSLRRALKIIPPFYLVTLLLAVYYVWHYKDPAYIKTGLCWATGIAHFIPMPVYFNLSFWSLWVEVGFYVVLPLLFFLTRGLDARKTGQILFWTLLLVPTIVRAILWQDVEPGDSVIVNNRFPNALDNFAWGVWFASFYATAQPDQVGRKRLGLVGCFGVGLLFISCLLFTVSSNYLSLRAETELEHFLPGFSAMLILFLVFDPGCPLARFFSAPWLRFLGLVSYEWFLIHQPAQVEFRQWFGSSQGNILLYMVKVLVPSLGALIVSVVIYQVLSLPLLRWGRKKKSLGAPKPDSLPTA
jgi:peptidoglycan/LPS O-acetylase OafA/YrhL